MLLYRSAVLSLSLLVIVSLIKLPVNHSMLCSPSDFFMKKKNPRYNSCFNDLPFLPYFVYLSVIIRLPLKIFEPLNGQIQSEAQMFSPMIKPRFAFVQGKLTT